MENSVQVETKYEDREEVLPDGTIYTSHVKRQVKHKRERSKSPIGKGNGVISEDIIETFEQPAKLITSKEIIEQTLPSGRKVHRKMTVNQMVHSIKTHHMSFDEVAGNSEEEFEIEEVVPGTYSCFVETSDSSDVEDEGPLEAVTPRGPTLQPPILTRRISPSSSPPGGDDIHVHAASLHINDMNQKSTDEGDSAVSTP